MGEKRYTLDSIFEEVKRILVLKLGVLEEEITLQSRIADDLGADSLDMVELIMEVEKDFNIAIPDEECEHIVTVNEAVAVIGQKIGGDGLTFGKTELVQEKEYHPDMSNDDYLAPLPIQVDYITDKRYLTTIRRFQLKEDWRLPDLIQGEEGMHQNVSRRYAMLLGEKGDILEEVVNKPNVFLNVSKLRRMIDAGVIKPGHVDSFMNFGYVLGQPMRLDDYNITLQSDMRGVRNDRYYRQNPEEREVMLQNNIRVKKTFHNLEMIEPIDVKESLLLTDLGYSLKKVGGAYKRKMKTLAKINEDLTDLRYILDIEED